MTSLDNEPWGWQGTRILSQTLHDLKELSPISTGDYVKPKSLLNFLRETLGIKSEISKELGEEQNGLKAQETAQEE